MKTKLSKTNRGFTLVELLVVLAIIGLLAAIGIPAILNAQRASRNTVRIKQLEAVRNAAAEFYTRNNTNVQYIGTTLTGNTCSGGGSTMTGASTVCVGGLTGANGIMAVQNASTYTFTLLSGTTCTQPSSGNNVTFVHDATNGTMTLCKEGNGTEVMSYK